MLKKSTHGFLFPLLVTLLCFTAYPPLAAIGETLLAPLLLSPTILPPIQINAGNIPASTITNPMLANMAASSVKCNDTGAASSPQDCTSLPSGLTIPVPSTSNLTDTGASGIYSTNGGQFGTPGGNPPDAEFEVYSSGGMTAHFHGTGVQSTTGGGLVSINSTPTGTPAAIAIGNRLGTLQYGGTYDNTLALANGPTIGAYTTQNWSSSAMGSQIQFKTVPNNSTTRTLALTLDQDQSATFSGKVTVNGSTLAASGITATSVNGVTTDSTTNKPVTAASLNGNTLPASLTGLALSGALTGGQTATFGTINGSGSINMGTQAGSGAATALQMAANSTHINWLLSTNYFANDALEITPSTAGGGVTFTTPTLKLLTGGLTITGGITQSTAKSCSLGVVTDSNGLFSSCVASDESLKTHMRDLPYDPNFITNVHPKEYEWAQEEKSKRDAQFHAGWGANQVRKVAPLAAVPAGKGKWGVDPNAINAYLTLEVKHQRTTIEQQQREIDGLFVIVGKLEERMKKISRESGN